MTNTILKYFIFLSCLGVVSQLSAQRPTTAPPTTGTSDGLGASTYIASDTSKLTYYFAGRPELAFEEGDSMPDRSFYMVDPTRQGKMDWANLGNIGSPARPLFFERHWRQGFDVGANVFDLYAVNPDSLRYYRSKGSFTDLQYAQGRSQSEGIFRGKFARTFSDDINFSLDYKGINHAGQFLHQRVKHNALSFGLWIPKKKRWQGFLSYSQNVFREQANGGVPDSITSIVSGTLSGPLGIPINLSEESALNRIGNWTLLGTQHLDLIGKKGGRKLSIVHEITWGKERYKFFDETDSEDYTGANAQFLGNTFYTDPRGIRHQWRTTKLENKFKLRTFKVRTDGGNDQLSVGLEHGYWRVWHSPMYMDFNQLFLTGNLALKLKNTLGIEARGAFGLLENALEYNLEGKIFWSLGKAGTLRGEVLQQRVPVFELHKRLYLSDRIVWDNNFEKLFETKISGTYSLPIAGLQVTAQNQTINNFIYFDSNKLAQQVGSVNITQLLIKENIRWRSLGLENTLALQTSSNEAALRLPNWYYRGSAYVEGLIFQKNMLARFGIGTRLNAPFFGDSYMPVTWQFYRQDVRELPTYPWFDIFLSLKVQKFRFFVRYENIGDTLFTNDLHFLTQNYPQMPSQLRISIAWRFRDL